MRGRHVLIALVSLLVLLGLLFLSFYVLDDVLDHPELYFTEPVTEGDLARAVFALSGAVVSALIAYIIYLLLGSRVRVEAAAFARTKELAVTGEELRRLYDRAPVPYVLIDRGGTIMRPNKAALRLFGVVAEELEGTALLSLVAPDYADRAKQLLAKFKHGVAVDREETQVIRNDGQRRWILLSLHEMSGVGGRERGGLVTLFDITHEKELDQAKTEFLSLASHQLRTPLSTVKWYTEILLSGDFGALTEKQHEYVNKLHEANQNMVSLVDLLLNVSRLHMGRLAVEKLPTDLTDVVNSVIGELEPTILEKRIAVQRRIDSTCVHMKTDPKLLRIILQNLLSNAVKYTPDGGKIGILCTRSSGSHRITVSDTGYGIPDEEQGKIFTKLYRASNVKEHSVEGSGLGLYLVKSIVELLGGTISFTSALNKGTSFTVTFPS